MMLGRVTHWLNAHDGVGTHGCHYLDTCLSTLRFCDIIVANHMYCDGILI
jgi:hypothetical protein